MFCLIIYIFTNSFEIFIHIIIGYSQHFKTVLFKELRPCKVFLSLFVAIMLRTVDLNNEICLGTIKINNILSDDFLTQEFKSVIPQKIVPEMSFFFGHVFSQKSRRWRLNVCCVCGSYNPSVTPSARHLPLHKGGKYVFPLRLTPKIGRTVCAR